MGSYASNNLPLSGLSSAPGATLSAIATELDSTYRDVLDRLPENPAVRFAENGDKTELILSPLDAIEETPSLIALRQRVTDMLPRVDLPELILESMPGHISPVPLPIHQSKAPASQT